MSSQQRENISLKDRACAQWKCSETCGISHGKNRSMCLEKSANKQGKAANFQVHLFQKGELVCTF